MEAGEHLQDTNDPLGGLGSECVALYEVIPADGSAISNKAAREALGWESEPYFSVRDRLEDAGFILRGRGRGGTVRRIPEKAPAEPGDAEVEAATVDEAADALADSFRREHDLYDPMREVIESKWARDRRATPIAVEVTAHGGSRPTGIWARPDITSVEVRVFAHVPGKHLEVVTFEVKPSDAITVQAVYEALAHRRAATRSYVLLHVPADQRQDLESAVTELSEVARAHGIGVITAEDPADYETWEEREVADRVEPDPERLDRFIGRQMSETSRTAIGIQLR
ncbi:MAG TPA: hypothetical protein VLI94_00780 [Solirubrobacterales bacterium]|nr:hypothetical protein [Solirubrobacterales bacterium]